MASVLEIAKKLNREFKDDKLAIKADITPNYERMSTGAFGFDYPLYGGLPLGRICTFAGLFHSGKTLAACIAMAAYQRKFPERLCVYVDLEHSLDIKFMSRMTGLDPEKMIYFNPTNLTGEQVLDSILEFQKSGTSGHGCCNGANLRVTVSQFHHCFTEHSGEILTVLIFSIMKF